MLKKKSKYLVLNALFILVLSSSSQFLFYGQSVYATSKNSDAIELKTKQSSESQSSESQSSESQGSESQGSESQGSESQGSESQGSESQSSESQSSESQGSESQSSESQSSESQSSESQSSESQGSESQGSESQRHKGYLGSKYVPEGAIRIDKLFASPVSSGVSHKDFGVFTRWSFEDNGGLPYSELSLKDDKNWGAIWSREKYKLDFSKDFKGRAFLRFVSDDEKDRDGFAFVMHNDPGANGGGGTKALTRAHGNNDGQNLGVYGSARADSGKKWGKKGTPEEPAIQNSVAVEFDMYTNKKNDIIGKYYMYDYGEKEAPHMAHAFPGNLAKTYTPMRQSGAIADAWFGSFGALTEREAKLNHIGTTSLNQEGVVRVDRSWYEFNFQFTSKTKEFKYYIKNPMNNKITNVTTIDWADLSSELDLQNNDQKAYWGFTMANGGAEGKSSIVFADVPVNLEANLENDVTTETNDSVVDSSDSTDITNKFINQGEVVKLKSKFTVCKGENSVSLNSWIVNIDETLYDLNSIENIKVIKDNKKITGKVTLDPNGQGILNVTFNEKVTVFENECITLELTIRTKNSGDTANKKTYFNSWIEGTENSPLAEPVEFYSKSVYFWIKSDSFYLEKIPTEYKFSADLKDKLYRLSTKLEKESIKVNNSNPNRNWRVDAKFDEKLVLKRDPSVSFPVSSFKINDIELKNDSNSFIVLFGSNDNKNEQIIDKVSLEFKDEYNFLKENDEVMGSVTYMLSDIP